MEKIREGFTRVTECLSVYNDFSMIAPAVLKNACERGTRVHRYAELYANDEYFPDLDKSDEACGYLESFKSWFDAVVKRVVSLEMRLYSDVLKLTGAIDAVVVIHGAEEPVIVDYKTPAMESKSWALQLSAYKWLYNNDLNTKVKAERRIALMLKKDGGKAKVCEYTNTGDLKTYIGALEAYRHFNEC